MHNIGGSERSSAPSPVPLRVTVSEPLSGSRMPRAVALLVLFVAMLLTLGGCSVSIDGPSTERFESAAKRNGMTPSTDLCEQYITQYSGELSSALASASSGSDDSMASGPSMADITTCSVAMKADDNTHRISALLMYLEVDDRSIVESMTSNMESNKTLSSLFKSDDAGYSASTSVAGNDLWIGIYTARNSILLVVGNSDELRPVVKESGFATHIVDKRSLVIAGVVVLAIIVDRKSVV